MELIKEIESRRDKNGNLRRWGLYICPNPLCNKEVERSFSHGKIAKSCGCMKNKAVSKARTKHGGFGTKLYQVWAGIKTRTLNIKNKDYSNYGGRGITIYNDWLEFIPFRDWTLNNGYAEGLQINRINNNGNYEPSNCNFVTCKENSRNRKKQKIKNIEMSNEIRILWKTKNYTQK